jgi:hypothetical protein
MPRVDLQFVNDFFRRSLDKSRTIDDSQAKHWKRRAFLQNKHITAKVQQTTVNKQDKDKLFLCQQTLHSHANIHDWRVLIGKKSELITEQTSNITASTFNKKLYIYRVIKKSLCTWWLQYRKLQVMFSVPRQSPHIHWHTELCSV